MRIVEFAFAGVGFEWRGQGSGSSRSVVTAWKTVTKLFGRVTASWGVKFEGICVISLVSIIKQRGRRTATFPIRISGTVANS